MHRSILERADAGLYLAKRHGRNGWVGLLAIDGFHSDAYVAPIKSDALAMIRAGILSCGSSIDELSLLPPRVGDNG